MSTGERLQQFLDLINLTVYRFEVEVGLSVSAASRVIQGKQEFSTPNLQKIHKKYPELNLDWYLTGRGDMFIGSKLEEFIKILEQEIKIKREQELEVKRTRKALEHRLLVLADEVQNTNEHASNLYRMPSETEEID